jgi:hypothetical protein
MAFQNLGNLPHHYMLSAPRRALHVLFNFASTILMGDLHMPQNIPLAVGGTI